MDRNACFWARKPWLTAEKPGDNHVFELRNDFCFIHCCCPHDCSFVADAGLGGLGGGSAQGNRRSLNG
jgi:hypothetical protein